MRRIRKHALEREDAMRDSPTVVWGNPTAIAPGTGSCDLGRSTPAASGAACHPRRQGPARRTVLSSDAAISTRVQALPLVDAPPHRVAGRRPALAGGAAELPRPPDARVDEVLGDGGHPQHRHGGELGLHARAVQVGLRLPQPHRRLRGGPVQPAAHDLRQPLRVVGGDVVDRARHDATTSCSWPARSWGSARPSTSRRRWRSSPTTTPAPRARGRWGCTRWPSTAA